VKGPSTAALLVPAPLWHEAAGMLGGVVESVRRQARSVFESIEWLCAARTVHQRPSIRVTSDGALMIEWLLPDRSLSIFFEEHEQDSGWCFSSLPSAGSMMSLTLRRRAAFASRRPERRAPARLSL
jgi:hypothetical protein